MSIRRLSVVPVLGATLMLVGCLQDPVPDVAPRNTNHSPRAAAKGAAAYTEHPRYIITLAQGAGHPGRAAASLGAQHGFSVGHVYEHALQGFSAALPAQALAALERHPMVDKVEPDMVMHAIAQTLPTGIDRVDADLNATAAIDNTGSDLDVDIAIIDTGIDDDNPAELNVAGGIRYYTVNSGPPWQRGSFADANYDDNNGHGSHVAGTAAARDNQGGVVGMAPGARLWAVKVLDASGSGYLSDIIKGVDWVTANAATIEVANMSLGGQGSSSAFRTAIQSCVAAGVVMVVAAGNDGQDVFGGDLTFGTGDDFIPAAYPEAAAVSAQIDTDGQPGGLGSATSYGGDDQLASFSNYSSGTAPGNPVNSPGGAIDLAAPGVNILSTWYDGSLQSISGTSMASPHVAGGAALHIAANGRALDAAGVYAIRQTLIDAAQPQSQWGPANTADPDANPEGLLYVGAGGNSVPVVSITAPADGSNFVAGSTISFQGTASDFEDGDLTASLAWASSLDGAIGTGGSFSLSTLSTGQHLITASVTDAGGATGSASVTVTVEPATTDLAVTGLSAPASANQGDLVPVQVDVVNVGNQNVAADIQIDLYDDTDASLIGSQIISGGLAAGASTSLVFDWNTAGASFGTHTLRAEQIVADDEAGNDSRTASVEILDPAATPTLHVSDLDGSVNIKGKSGKWEAFVAVSVVDNSGSPVANATVTGAWSTGGTSTGTTDGSGRVTLASGNIEGTSSTTFTVQAISHATLTYDPAANTDPDGDSDGTAIIVSR